MFFIVPKINKKMRKKLVEMWSFLENNFMIVETPDGEIALRLAGNIYGDGKSRLWELYITKYGYELYRRDDLEKLRDKITKPIHLWDAELLGYRRPKRKSL